MGFTVHVYHNWLGTFVSYIPCEYCHRLIHSSTSGKLTVEALIFIPQAQATGWSSSYINYQLTWHSYIMYAHVDNKRIMAS